MSGANFFGVRRTIRYLLLKVLYRVPFSVYLIRFLSPHARGTKHKLKFNFKKYIFWNGSLFSKILTVFKTTCHIFVRNKTGIYVK